MTLGKEGQTVTPQLHGPGCRKLQDLSSNSGSNDGTICSAVLSRWLSWHLSSHLILAAIL